ncbi:MAG: DUF4184 family protein [Kofleriaceae bacterium]
MPVTPFHFGPGLALKGLAPRSVSWTAFVASNVVIDCESFYYLTRGKWPVHRTLHTFVGAAIVGVATAVVLLAIRTILRKRASSIAIGPFVRAETSTRGIWIGAMCGALSHPVLDGIMHPDIEPFQPFSVSNPLHGLVALGPLHLGCALAGLVGVVLLLVRSRDRVTT